MCTRAAMIRRVIRKAGAAEPFAFSAPLAWRRVVNATVVTAFFHAGYRRITSHIDKQMDRSMNGDPANALEARLDRTTRTKEPCPGSAARARAGKPKPAHSPLRAGATALRVGDIDSRSGFREGIVGNAAESASHIDWRASYGSQVRHRKSDALVRDLKAAQMGAQCLQGSIKSAGPSPIR
jgi:hypothetical protein